MKVQLSVQLVNINRPVDNLLYYIHTIQAAVLIIVVFIAGCGDNIAVLGGWQGTFGISEVPFENNMTCMWKIQVYSTTQVSD